MADRQEKECLGVKWHGRLHALYAATGYTPVTNLSVQTHKCYTQRVLATGRTEAMLERGKPQGLMLKNRKYKSGSRWALWRWTTVDSEFITRLHVVMTPWFAICLHWLHKPDPEPYLHDHPVSFLSLILRGGYTEKRYLKGETRIKFRDWYNWIPAACYDRHSIIHTKPKTLTLCLMGPKKRDWGYHTPEGWVYWRDYMKEHYRAN